MKYHESHFCPVTCKLSELAKAIKATPDQGRRDFLQGVEHARIMIAGLTGDRKFAS